MPPRLTLLSHTRSIPFRCRPSSQRWLPAPTVRCYSKESDLQKSSDKKGPNTETLPDINAENEALSKGKGDKRPDLEQGTPLADVVKGDKAAQENLPKIMKDSLSGSKRSFSTSALRRDQLSVTGPGPDPVPEGIVTAGTTELAQSSGLKFDPVQLPLPPEDTLKRRYDPVVEQFVGLIMRHGEKAKAQRVHRSSATWVGTD